MSVSAGALSVLYLQMPSLSEQLDSLWASMHEERDISGARMQLLRFEIVDLKSQVAHLELHVANLEAQVIALQNPSVPPQAEAPSLSPDHEGES